MNQGIECKVLEVPELNFGIRFIFNWRVANRLQSDAGYALYFLIYNQNSTVLVLTSKFVLVPCELCLLPYRHSYRNTVKMSLTMNLATFGTLYSILMILLYFQLQTASSSIHSSQHSILGASRYRKQVQRLDIVFFNSFQIWTSLSP